MPVGSTRAESQTLPPDSIPARNRRAMPPGVRRKAGSRPRYQRITGREETGRLWWMCPAADDLPVAALLDENLQRVYRQLRNRNHRVDQPVAVLLHQPQLRLVFVSYLKKSICLTPVSSPDCPLAFK